MTRPLRAPTAMLAGIGFGVLATYLLFEQQPGVGYPLLIAAFVGLVFGLGYVQGLRPLWSNGWLIVPLLFFSAMVALRTNTTLTVLNVVAGLGLLALLLTTWGHQPLSRFTSFGYGLASLAAGISTLVHPLFVIADLVSQGFPARTRHVVRPIVVGLLIAVPFLAIFTLLFASADAIFARALTDVWKDFDVARLLAQAGFALLYAWLAVGALDQVLGRRARPFARPVEETALAVEQPTATVGSRGPLGIGETSVVLALILGLFIAFVVFQLRYLFLPPDQLGYDFNTITYSEYAREGFFQLLVVAALVISLMVLLESITRRTRRLHHWFFNSLTVALIGCTFVIVISSFRRLQLYGFEHSFTHLRLFSHTFTVWLAVVLILLLVAIVLSRPRIFAFGGFVSMLLYLGALDVLNPDAFIASTNLDHATVYGKPLDRRNFVPLGSDAVPVLVARLDELDPINRRAIEQLLFLQLADVERGMALTGWQSANPARDEARRLLAQRDDDLRLACVDETDRSPAYIRAGSRSIEQRQIWINDLQPLCFRSTAMSNP